MPLLNNYKNDLLKSRTTPLLIELSKKDLDSMCKDDVCGVSISLAVAKSIYDISLKDTTETNLIFIDADNTKSKDHIYLLEEFLDITKEHLTYIKNRVILKESISAGLSLATGGLLNDAVGDVINSGVEMLAENISSDVTDILIDATLDYVDIGEKITDILESKLFDFTNDSAIEFLDSIKENKLYLSPKSKEAIAELSKHFKETLTPAESFRFILELMLSVTIDMPTLLYVKNPHKLDKDSLAILSLLFSVAKDKKYTDKKDTNKHIGLSVVYAYEDEEFQPYTEVKDEYKLSKQLLDEQRLYTQRYAMLERPTSDIPHIAVKSWMFVGREDELENLNARYVYSKENTDIATLETISAEPGIGKTKLVKKHLSQIRSKEKNNLKQIQLTLLNQTGHTSSNTGLGSLIDAIVKEASRLETVKTWSENLKDKGKEYIFGAVVDMVKSTLGVNALIGIGKAINDSVFLEGQMERTKLNSVNPNNKSQDEKQIQFTNLTIAIKELKKLSDDSVPIILFIDDLQWIDEDSSEYILEHFIKQFNVHIVATIRPGDATTVLGKAVDNQDQNKFKIALLKKVNIKLQDKDNNEITIESDIDVQTLESRTTHLSGLNTKTLQELIVKVIEGDEKHQEILAKTIINELNNDKTKDEVNTLFAVETINMLCDRRFYFTKDKSGVELPKVEPQLIATDGVLKFNNKLNDKIEVVIKDTFENLEKHYKSSFEHNNSEGKDLVPTFNLMAYAVLEERLNILKSYFGDHGNAAVNTLLFSSLLGTPFNSVIVKNILVALANTNEELLKPLGKYIRKGKDEITLNESHYEIIEEVYEILSRYQAFNSAFAYRHSLLNIFLDKQLEYQLDSVFQKDTINAKYKLYSLVLKKIEEKEEQQDFYEEEAANLNRRQYESMIFFKEARVNVLEKEYQLIPNVSAYRYTKNLFNLVTLYRDINQIEKAIELGEEALLITKELYDKYPEKQTQSRSYNYILSLNIQANLYVKINQIAKAIELGEEALTITKVFYDNDPERRTKVYINKWSEIYILNLSSLAGLYGDNDRTEKAIELGEEVLAIIKDLCDNNFRRWVVVYMSVLNNMTAMYGKMDRTERAIELGEEALTITKVFYDKYRDRWAGTYIHSLINLVALYNYNIDRTEKAIELGEEALNITKELYDKYSDRWAEPYRIILNNLVSLYENEGQVKKATETLMVQYKVSKKHFGENDPMTLSVLQKIEMFTREDDTVSVTFEDLLYLSKGLAYYNEEVAISYQSFLDALSFMDFTEQAQKAFSLIINLDELPKFDDSEQFIELAKKSPKLFYSEDLKILIEQLKEIFGDELLGTLR